MVARQQLAARRKALGFSQESLAHSIEVASASVARWEQGTSTPSAKSRGPLAARLDLTLPELEQLLAVNASTALALNGHAVPQWLGHYASLEQGAARLQTFEPISIPGLLQTQDYATAVIRTHYMPVSDEDVRQRVQARIARQAVLDRDPNPLKLSCVVDESVLHRVTGGAGIMAAQLRHLCAMAGRPGIELQIVPSDGGAIHCAAFGSFDLFMSVGSTAPFMACSEDVTGFHYQESPAAIETFSVLFEHLAKVALSPADSADLIETTAEHYQ